MVILIIHIKFISGGCKRQDRTDKILLINEKLKLQVK